jgi:hypothetical protein
MRMVRRQRWGLALAVVTALGGLMVAGRLLDLPQDRRPPARPPPSTTPAAVVSVVTLPPTVIPDRLRRPLRLPSLGPGRSCPATAVAGPLMTPALDGRLDPSAVAYWDAPEPLGGPAIVRGHRLGAPRDRIRFLNDREVFSPVHVLDPAAAHPAGQQGGRWWRATRLRAAAGCYGLQIDGPSFSEVLVVEFG